MPQLHKQLEQRSIRTSSGAVIPDQGRRHRFILQGNHSGIAVFDSAYLSPDVPVEVLKKE